MKQTSGTTKLKTGVHKGWLAIYLYIILADYATCINFVHSLAFLNLY